MRVLVFLKVAGVAERILWASEAKSGVYLGLCTDRVDTHMSYHADGIRHTRIAKTHHQRWQDVPLINHTGFKQLLHGNIPLRSQPRLGSLKAASARDDVICLEERYFLGHDSVAVDVWLSDTASKSALDRAAQSVHSRHGFKFVAHKAWRLQSFPSLVFAMSFWAASTSVPAASGCGVGA